MESDNSRHHLRITDDNTGIPMKEGSGQLMTSIEFIRFEDRTTVLELFERVFRSVMPEVASYVESVADWNISVLIRHNGIIAGCYILNEEPVPYRMENTFEDLSVYHPTNKKGIQGVALAVDEKYRGLGLGAALRAYPGSCCYDYIWGMHFHTLKNVHHFQKYGRRIIADTGAVYFTLMDYPAKAPFEKHHRFQKTGYDCGPNCISMIASWLGKPIVDDAILNQWCETRPDCGTPDSGIKRALDRLCIRSRQNKSMEAGDAFRFLNNTLHGGRPFLLRTLTMGLKHWIVVYGQENGRYLIADPWLGLITYSKEEIQAIWQPRDFDGFAIG